MLLVSIKEEERGETGGRKGTFLFLVLPSETKFRERVFHSFLVRIWSLPEKKRGGKSGRKWTERKSEKDSKGKSSVVDGWIDVSAEKDGKRKKNSQ